MPRDPLEVHGLNASSIHDKIELLIRGLVHNEDTTGKFLLKLKDGRIIDTKGWNDWEWSKNLRSTR
jgi:unsaturated rhamnogalacturonyl hydrolase